MDVLLHSYEEVPYPSDPVYQTHPDALATAAFLAGMSPPAVDRCRVLEIGCGTGGNLVALAATLPESRFVGIDLSPRQIAAGQEMADALGLTNLELRAGDIVNAQLDEFDYLICHGVFSWCPPSVQEHILELCRTKMARHGVAYISYNTLPGWHALGLLRDLLRWGGARQKDPQARVREGRRFLEIAAEAGAGFDARYGEALRDGIAKLRGLPDEYLLHEFMEDYNQPLHLYEVAERAQAHGLQYLGESCRQVAAADLPPWMRETRELAGDPIALQQNVDFVRNASFRRSLFCHAGTLPLPEPSRIMALHAHGTCEPISPEPDLQHDVEEAFRAEAGQLKTDIPLVKAVLVALHRVWPRTLSLHELAADVRVRLDAVDDPDLSDELVAEVALQCHGSNLLALHLHPPRFASQAGERPIAAPMARLQASRGAAEVTNFRHRNLPLNPLELALVAKLDGTRDRAALVEELIHAGLIIEKDGRAVSDPEELRPLVAAALEPTLGRLAQAALLEAF